MTNLADRDVFIAAAVRTPMGSLGGAVSSLSAVDLGAVAVQAALDRSSVPAAAVEQCILGHVLQAGCGQHSARQAALKAGLPKTVPCSTVNKMCSSGLKAVAYAADAIRLGDADVVVAGGMESMSNCPYYLSKARTGYRYGHAQMIDGCIHDGLWDPTYDCHMGNCAEKTASDHGLSREDQDEYAMRSYEKATDAHAKGAFAPEIVPVTIKGTRGKPDVVVSEDEEFKRYNKEKMPKLRAAFQDNGTVTAGNASPVSDGAAALVVVSGAKCKELGLAPVARILGYADAATDPMDFPTAPASAVPIALKKANLSQDQIDFFEVNEAFAAVPLANGKILGLPMDKVNVHGGAVALGHPIGCSGARILATLIGVLKQHSATYGVAGICNGGGGASAMVIELVGK